MKTTIRTILTGVLIAIISGNVLAQNPGANFIPKDPKFDNLLTSENTVLLVIDFQEEMMGVVKNIDREILTNNTKAMIKTAQVFNIPIIESTIGVNLGANKSTLPEFKKLMPEVKNIDRISLNAWQNREVITAVEKTGRKKLIKN